MGKYSNVPNIIKIGQLVLDADMIKKHIFLLRELQHRYFHNKIDFDFSTQHMAYFALRSYTRKCEKVIV